MSIRLIIFDLDDTLSDHHHSSVCGIHALQERFLPMAEASLDDLGSALQHWLGHIGCVGSRVRCQAQL